MEQGLSSPIWQASPSSCAAKMTACWIRSRSKAVCTCQLTSSSAAKTSGLVRQLYDCPDVPVGKTGYCCRVVVATHPATEKKSRIGHTRKGVVYELFFTDLPQDAFTASDVVALYLHRGAFEPVLSDEDQ